MKPASAIFFALLCAIAVAPIAPVLADSSSTKAAASDQMAPRGSTGVYDSLDHFKDSSGYPLPGDTYLFNEPN
jgi:hypothetical protein